MPQKSQLGLPAGYRRRALARVDALIAKAGLRQAEYRLTLLRRSRRWMTAGHQPPG